MSRKTSNTRAGMGSSAPQRTSTGSGSRPTGGKFPIPTSKPSNAKKIRGG